MLHISKPARWVLKLERKVALVLLPGKAAGTLSQLLPVGNAHFKLYEHFFSGLESSKGVY
jgi:hypothetical protein